MEIHPAVFWLIVALLVFMAPAYWASVAIFWHRWEDTWYVSARVGTTGFELLPPVLLGPVYVFWKVVTGGIPDLSSKLHGWWYVQRRGEPSD